MVTYTQLMDQQTELKLLKQIIYWRIHTEFNFYHYI